jgi:hypothetical protein
LERRPGSNSARIIQPFARRVGTVSLWVYYDYSFGLSTNGAVYTHLSFVNRPQTGQGKYIGVESSLTTINFRRLQRQTVRATGGDQEDDWKHYVFTDDGKARKSQSTTPPRAFRWRPVAISGISPW